MKKIKIAHFLALYEGDKTRAAWDLQIDRVTLYRWIKKGEYLPDLGAFRAKELWPQKFK